MTIKYFCLIKSSFVSTMCLVWLPYLVFCPNFFLGGWGVLAQAPVINTCQHALLFNPVNEFLMRFQHSSIKVGISKTQVCQTGVLTVCNNGFSISVEKQFHRHSFCNMQKNSAEWRPADKQECWMLVWWKITVPAREQKRHLSFLNCLDKSGMYQNAVIQKKLLTISASNLLCTYQDQKLHSSSRKRGFPAR